MATVNMTQKDDQTDDQQEPHAPDTQHAIAETAYRLWEEEGRPEGKHEEHWRQAEKQLNGGPVRSL